MNCPWHPNKRVVAACKECGADFCIECVRETDQTTLCPDCFRRKMGEVAKEFEATEEKSEAAAPAAAAPTEKPSREKVETAAAVTAEEGAEEATVSRPAKTAAVAGILGRKRRKERRKRPAPVSEPPAPPQEDFLSQGPDEDFSEVTGRKERKGRWGRKVEAAAVPAAEEVEAPAVEEAEPARKQAGKVKEKPPVGEEVPAAETAASSEDYLLQDVVSTLLKPEAAAVESTAVKAEAVPEAAPAPVKRAPAKVKKERPKKPAKAKVKKERDPERWSFLAQPRSSEYTMLGRSWWRSALFIALVLFAGAVVWSVVNVYLIPGDKEYGILAFFIGAILGIAFWWKAGKKHGTKLAVQASLTTFFALFIGEFLLWFLTIMRFSAFRTIFFDLISFKFIWENGAEIMKNVMEAMFPTSFIWLLLLPTAVAFIIGFGLPPIPEIFSQFWHALRGDVPEEKEASHGLES